MNIELYNKIRKQFHKHDAKLLLINTYIVPWDYWYNINKNSEIHSTGFCYIASEVYYHQSGKSKEWWVKKLVSDKLPYNGHHFFLQHKETGEIVDLTSDQFGDLDIPYGDAKNISIRFESKVYKQFLKLMEDTESNKNEKD